MQLEETIAKEFADIVKEYLGKYREEVRALETRLVEVEGHKPEMDAAPTSMVDEISKAVALLAEAPPLTQARDNGPVVVQFTPPLGKRVKTITTRRDDKGNLVARVVED